jgi:hypothetical protein
MSVKFPLPLPFLRTKEAARFIGVSCRTLEKHRIYGTGPKYSKLGGRIIYAVTDLGEWAERGARRSTSDAGGTTIPPAKPVDKASRIEPVPDGATGVKRNAAGQPARLGTPAAARLVGVSPRTLEKHRVYGPGPNYSKVSGRVFYAIGDPTKWPNAALLYGVRRSIQARQPCWAQYQPAGVPRG